MTLKQTIPREGGLSFYMPKGPCPMHEVVLMAVSAAVKTDITSWITDFQNSLFFIFLLRFMFFINFVATRHGSSMLDSALVAPKSLVNT